MATFRSMGLQHKNAQKNELNLQRQLHQNCVREDKNLFRIKNIPSVYTFVCGNQKIVCILMHKAIHLQYLSPMFVQSCMVPKKRSSHRDLTIRSDRRNVLYRMQSCTDCQHTIVGDFVRVCTNTLSAFTTVTQRRLAANIRIFIWLCFENNRFCQWTLEGIVCVGTAHARGQTRCTVDITANFRHA